MNEEKEFKRLLDYLYKMEMELSTNLDYIRDMIKKVGGTTLEIMNAPKTKPRVEISEEAPEEEDAEAKPVSRPTEDAPEMPGRRRRECSICKTMQYGVKNGVCEPCTEAEE